MLIPRVTDRDEGTVRVLITCRTRRESDSQHKGLLQDQHQDGREYGRAIATGRTEDGHILIVEGTGGNSLLTSRITTTQHRLQLITHLHGHHLCRLEDSLIGEHQTHVAIDADDPSFQSIHILGETAGDEIDSLDKLSADQ